MPEPQPIDPEPESWVLQHHSSLAGSVYLTGIEGAFRHYSRDQSHAQRFDRRGAEAFAAKHPQYALIPQRRRDDPANIPDTGQ